MSREPELYLEDILESIGRIESYTEDMTRDEFEDAPAIQDAVLRRFEVIGEAVKNLPEDLRDEHDQVRWGDIAGLRDVLIHAYFRVNVERVWKAIQDDLPELKRKVEGILEVRD